MKKKLLLNLILCVGFILAQNEEKIDSKVISATVFKNRALVIREAQIDLSKGKHKLIFSSLPVDLLNESVRISASGTSIIKILDVNVEQRFTTETQQKNIKALQRQIDSLDQLKQISRDEIAIYESKKQFVESLKAQSSKSISEKMLLDMKSANLNDIVKYVENNLIDIYKGLREENRKISFYEQQMDALYKEINESEGRKTKNFKEVIVTVETNKNEKVKLHPSYIVQNASWYPLYDARVSSELKEAEISYYGMIQQSTGEDWKDISLTLSTAEPMSVKSLPELERWFVDIKPLPVKQPSANINQNRSQQYQVSYDQNWGIPAGKGSITGYIIENSTGEPLVGANVILEGTSMGSVTDVNGKFLISNVPAGYYNLSGSYVGFIKVRTSINVIEKNIANITLPLEETTIDELGEVVVTSEKPIVHMNQSVTSAMVVRGGLSDDLKEEIIYTNVYAKELSTTFEIPAKSSIPSDNSQHKVTIAIKNSPIEYSYTSIPKITQSVYLKGKVVNNNNYPLLEGELNIFVDNDFISRTYLPTVVPTDTMVLALGIDERIQIKKILINKFQESKGLLGGSRQITYEYEIQVTNNRQTEESLTIFDQVPIAMNEDIKVELLDPKIEIKELGNDNKLELNFKLKPGEKKVIPVKYQIEFPNNINIYGLE
jgi:hypothetical protein